MMFCLFTRLSDWSGTPFVYACCNRDLWPFWPQVTRLCKWAGEQDSPRDWRGDDNKLPHAAFVHGHSKGKCDCSVGVISRACNNDWLCSPFYMFFNCLLVLISGSLLSYSYVLTILLSYYLGLKNFCAFFALNKLYTYTAFAGFCQEIA